MLAPAVDDCPKSSALTSIITWYCLLFYNTVSDFSPQAAQESPIYVLVWFPPFCASVFFHDTIWLSTRLHCAKYPWFSHIQRRLFSWHSDYIPGSTRLLYELPLVYPCTACIGIGPVGRSTRGSPFSLTRLSWRARLLWDYNGQTNCNNEMLAL